MSKSNSFWNVCFDVQRLCLISYPIGKFLEAVMQNFPLGPEQEIKWLVDLGGLDSLKGFCSMILHKVMSSTYGHVDLSVRTSEAGVLAVLVIGYNTLIC